MSPALETRARVVYGNVQPEMDFGDFHQHTKPGSDGTATVVQRLDQAEELGLKEIAITDHDNVGSSLEAREYAVKHGYHVRVLPAVEANTTRRRHIIFLGVEDDITPGKPPREMIKIAHRMGARVVIPHPMSSIIPSIGEHELNNLMNDPDPEVYIDAYEYNASLAHTNMGRRQLAEAVRFYLAHQDKLGAIIGSSDIHYRESKKKAYTAYRGSISDAIDRRETGVLFVEGEGTVKLSEVIEQASRSLIIEPSRYVGRYVRRVVTGDEQSRRQSAERARREITVYPSR